MLYDCWLHQCNFCGGDGNGAAYRWTGNQYYPNVQLSMLGALSQMLCHALAHVQRQLTSVVPMDEDGQPTKEAARALIAMAIGRPHIPWHLDNSIGTIETLEGLYRSEKWMDEQNPGVDCIACSVWSWRFSNSVFQESCRTIDPWPSEPLDSNAPFAPFAAAVFSSWGQELQSGNHHHYGNDECNFVIKDSPYVFLLSNVRLFLKPNDRDWHMPIHLNIRRKTQMAGRNRSEYSKTVQMDMRAIRYILDAHVKKSTLADLPKRLQRQLGLQFKKESNQKLFDISEDQQQLEITHAGKVKVMDLYN